MAIQNTTPLFGDLADGQGVGTGVTGEYNLVVDFAANPINTSGDSLEILTGAIGANLDILAVEVKDAITGGATSFNVGDDTDADEVVTTANGTLTVGAKTITKRTLTNGSPLTAADKLVITAVGGVATGGRVAIKLKAQSTQPVLDLATHREYETPS